VPIPGRSSCEIRNALMGPFLVGRVSRFPVPIAR